VQDDAVGHNIHAVSISRLIVLVKFYSELVIVLGVIYVYWLDQVTSPASAWDSWLVDKL